MKFPSLILFTLTSLTTLGRLSACDLCGSYSPPLIAPQSGAFPYHVGVAEQFTHFGTLQENGHEIGNPADQYLNSSITQLVFGASVLSERFSLQVNVPLIYRSFKRPEGFATDQGTVSGVGDLSLLASFVLFQTEGHCHGGNCEVSKDAKGGKVATMLAGEPDFTSSMSIFGGLKFPTGDSSRIKEEFSEIEVEGAPESGIHGHDLTLGSGSWDGVFGLQTLTRYKSLFFQADVQYSVRSEGDYGYRFANDLTWSGGPGVYFLRHDNKVLALQCVIAGETKGKDTFQGESAEDTGITSLYVGPRLLASLGHVSAEVGLDLPVMMHNTALQAVPDYRIRAGLTYHF